MPAGHRPPSRKRAVWARERLAVIGSQISPASLVSELNASEQGLVEIAKALALDPAVLILDEPTAALSQAETDHLFEQVRRIRAAGTAVVYISHRIPEVLAIADRMTVLRDGTNRGVYDVAGMSEDEILALIVGRSLDAVFPDKRAVAGSSALLAAGGHPRP